MSKLLKRVLMSGGGAGAKRPRYDAAFAYTDRQELEGALYINEPDYAEGWGGYYLDRTTPT